MKVLHAILIILCFLFVYTGEGKSSKMASKGSKSGARVCFERIEECTERESSTSGKGSSEIKGGLPYAIFCKDEKKEVCRHKVPKSHSMDRYQFGRCDFCQRYVLFSLPSLRPLFSRIYAYEREGKRGRAVAFVCFVRFRATKKQLFHTFAV